MSNEIMETGDGKKKVPDNVNQWERNLKKHGEQMRAVRSAAMKLVEKHPDEFTVTPMVNDVLSDISARTEFEVTLDDETIKFNLSVGVKAWHDGRFENSVNIREVGKQHLDGLSYRLDVVQGHDADEEHKRLSEFDTPSSEAEREMQQVLRGMVDNMFERDSNGSLSSLSDNYAETTIKTEGALILLKNAKKLKRPQEYGYTSGISLKA